MKKVSSITYTIVFIVVVGALGITSFTKLIHYYDTGIIENNEWIVELGSKLETDIATNYYKKSSFVNMNGAIHRLLGQREMNGVVKLQNGYLLTTFEYKEDEILQHNAKKIIQLSNYLDNEGIAFLYVIPPYTSAKYNSQLPEGSIDYGNNNLDRFAKMLKAGGVEPLDLRETMNEDGIDHYEMMYKTDHHWTTKAGFYAYTKINNILMQKLDCEVDQEVMDYKNYSVTTYPEWHLGSYGQRTGAAFAGIDDFDLILPTFETSISDGSNKGKFEDIVMNREVLTKKDLASRYTYDSVLWKTLGDFKNNKAKNDKKILVVTDSFGRAVNPFLIMSYSELRVGNADYETIRDYKPDAVIILHYINNTMKEDIYDNCARME
jgi:hypothetical protein